MVKEDDIWELIGLPDKQKIKKQCNIFTYPDYFIEIQKMLSQKLLKLNYGN